MASDGHFNVAARQREKEESRARDERNIDAGLISAEQLSRRNGFFSALDPSRARIVQYRASIRI